jgi:Uma2 family endonuclease
MGQQENNHFTPAEYLLLEEKAEYKSEYRQGEIVAMAGASINHNRITRNMLALLTNALEARPCETFANDLRLWVAKRNLYTYPDVMVICGQPQFIPGRTDTVTNPQVVVEVLSESTAAYDRGDKFQSYWTLESLRVYILIDQERVRVEYFQRVNEKEWLLRVLTKSEETLLIEPLEVALSLERIYRNVNWE